MLLETGQAQPNVRYNDEKKCGIQKIRPDLEKQSLSHKETPAHGENAAQQEASKKQKIFSLAKSKTPVRVRGGKKKIGILQHSGP